MTTNLSNNSASSYGQRTYNEINSFELIHKALGSGAWYAEFNEKGEIINCYFSNMFRRMLGYKDAIEFPNTANAFESILYKEDFDQTKKRLYDAINDRSGHTDFIAEYRLYTKNRGIRWFKSVARIARRSNNSPIAIIGVFVDIDEEKKYQERLELAEKSKEEQLKVLTSVANTFYSMHYLDLSTDRFIEYYASKEIAEITREKISAKDAMKSVMTYLVIKEDSDRIKEFCNLDTLSERMKGRKNLSAEFIGLNTGWFLANFICVDTDYEGNPDKFLFITQTIDEFKKRERTLFINSMTDELTGLLNRRAYEMGLRDFAEHGIERDYIFILIDLNGLKRVNDQFGHHEGDRFICGISNCIKELCRMYSDKEKAFRTGGDEFVVWFKTAGTTVAEIKCTFEALTSKFSIPNLHSAKASFGVVTGEEALAQNLTISEVLSLADKRMYEDKKRFYEQITL